MSRSLHAALAALALSVVACSPRVTPPDPWKGSPPPPSTPIYVAPHAVVIDPAPARTSSAEAAPVEIGGPAPCGPVREPPAPGAATVTVRFIDVGQGDAALVRTASGKTVLIDAGDRGASAAVLRELKEAKVERIDLLVASHPHLDHIGGMPAVLDTYPVRLYVDPGVDHATNAYRDLLLKLKEKKVAYQVLRAGKVLKLGDEATITVLFPGADLVKSSRSDVNANSLVLKLSTGDVDVLFTGDAEPETLGPVGDGAGGSIEVLKIAHHGSRFGTNARFLQVTGARSAVISASAGNDYGHPHRETVSALQDGCVPTFRTDRDGTVTFQTDGKGWSFKSSRGTRFADATAGIAGASRTAANDGAAPAEPEKALARGVVLASSRGKVYHPVGCPHVSRIKEENRMQYPSAAEAEAAGLRAGKGCRAGEDAGGAGETRVSTAPDSSRPSAPVAPVEGPVFASSRGSVYHPAGCPHVSRIKPENVTEFASAGDAEAAGLRAGKGCRAGGD